MRRREKRIVFWMLAALVLLCGLPAGAGAAPTAPSNDPFYAYKGSLAAVAPGTVLRTRQIQVSEAGTPQAYPATQILYRTTDQLGQPSATVATLIQPAGAGVAPVKLLSYQTFYDGVASTCRPSYTLQGGDPSNTTASADEALMLDYVSQGFAVVTSDYEGPTDDYGAGHESGQATLDAIRAAEHQMGLTARAPVGLVGYSGGSIASEWASELQPRYAPELNLIGVAEGGIPADYIHTTAYIDGSSSWAGAIPAVSLGLMRAYKLNVSKYASAKGLEIFKQVELGCLTPTAYPGLKLADLLKPQYKDWHKVPIFIRIFNNSIMSFAGTPKEPLLMGVGDADGTGDGVMIDKDVQELAYIYCSRHVPVQFHVYANSDHVEAAPQFEAQAVQFLQEVYNGQTPANECGSIAPGNPFTPLPVPKSQQPAPRIELRRAAFSSHAHGVAVVIAASRGVIRGVTVELVHGRTVTAKAVLPSVGTGARRLLLRVHGGLPPSGHYTLLVVVRRKTVARRAITIPKAR
ncbi:MAG TPA: lipase family protein [Solirubrobacteraceae bacterium]